jgi:hypothetical protein
MSRVDLLNLDMEEGLDMSGLGAGHVRAESLESGLGSNMSGLIGVFDGRVVF